MTYDPYAADPRYVPPPSHPQRTTILVCGILSLVCCGIATGVPAIVMGRRALREIDAGQYAATDRGTVQAGFVCGIIGTALSGAVLLFYLVAVVVTLATSGH